MMKNIGYQKKPHRKKRAHIESSDFENFCEGIGRRGDKGREETREGRTRERGEVRSAQEAKICHIASS